MYICNMKRYLTLIIIIFSVGSVYSQSNQQPLTPKQQEQALKQIEVMMPIIDRLSFLIAKRDSLERELTKTMDLINIEKDKLTILEQNAKRILGRRD